MSKRDTATVKALALTVNGTEISAALGSSVLEACRDAGIRIPTLCHDPRIEPYGACRLCVVEIEGMRGFPPSCVTKVAEGMVVRTDTEPLRELRRTIVELLVSDHPLDCMTCESNGCCELQAVAYEFQVTGSRFHGEKHSQTVEDDHPFISRDPAKCILCGRCVRICDEVMGLHVWDWSGRGFDAIADTPFHRPLAETQCVSCGQCVSTCPVGALTPRRRRFQGRPWEVKQAETICSYCGVGCTLVLESKDGVLVGSGTPVGMGVGGGNLCAKGRYGFEYVNHPERLTAPLVRRDGELVETTWEEAIDIVVAKLGGIRDEHGPDSVAGLASAKCTNEENYLFQKFMRLAIGTNNVDHCARL